MVPFEEGLAHRPLVGADLGTADGGWLLAFAGRAARWFGQVTGVAWSPAGRAFFAARMVGICRHWSDPSGHGLGRGSHRGGGGQAPWTCRRELGECWRTLEPRAVCRRQENAVTRLVMGTGTVPGYFEVLRAGRPAVSVRTAVLWGTAVWLCDPVVAQAATDAQRLRVRSAVVRYRMSARLDVDVDVEGVFPAAGMGLSA